eukprot:TRINITY_DN16727_c0_g3_i2.p1 TRINITY_DN16727_c0_g3~~TRINITY_DN16727_c0_g3_i2.p1  ORF type:complete len:501 (-),score=43.32 TRINITY_DN16727_c0_g3_i2:15-1517(-)
MPMDSNYSNLASSVFCYLDSDADGTLTRAEWTRQMSSYLGVAQSSLMALSTWGCKKWNIDGKPSFVHHFVSLLLIRLGRFDGTACLLAAAHEYSTRMDAAGTPERHSGSSIAKEDFVHILMHLMNNCKGSQKVSFQVAMGTGDDRCLSDEEYYTYMERKRQTYLRVARRDPDRSALVDWASSVSIPNFSSFVQKDSVLCVRSAAFADRTCESFISSLQNVTAPCSRQSEEIADDIGISTAVLSVAVCLFALCGVASFCLCTMFWIKSRRRRRMLDQSHQVQQLLRAKIDAWAILDSNLQAEASSLQPSFKRHLKITSSDQERVDLLAIVHPDYFDLLLAVRDQVAAQIGCNLPALAKVRLQLHSRVGNDEEYHVQYFPVELLLASDSKGQIYVGLTALAEVITDASKAAPAIFGMTHTFTEDESTSQGDGRTNSDEMVLSGSQRSCNGRGIEAKSEDSARAGGHVTVVQEKMAPSKLEASIRDGASSDPSSTRSASALHL